MIRPIHSHRWFFVICILACFLLRVPSWAQVANEKHDISLKSGTITTAPNAGRWLDSMSSHAQTNEPVQVLIHFNGLPAKAQRESLKQNGIILLDYIPENTFTALVQFPLDRAAVLAMPVHSFINTKPEWRSSDYLWKQLSTKKGQVEVLVSFYQGIDAQAIRQFISGVGGQVDHGAMESYGSFKVIIDASKVRSLAQWYGVRYISPVTDIVPLDLQSRPAVKGNIAVSSPVYGGYGLAGDSVTVGVGDNSSGIYHVDLKDRITNFNPAPQSHHGEHVNGIVGSAAIVDPLAASMAPHVSLIDHLYDLILPATGALYRDYNMTIGNNSYEVIAANCDYAGTYDVYSQLLDTLAIQYPYVQHVFASGNDGYMTCSPYLPGFATVGGGYQPAKNNIVVGSMTDYLDQASDESRGPVKDGRLKPEMVATGLGAYSTIGVDQYEWAAGTSMASPQVAGGLAVLTQRYKQVNGGAQPRADILKAILLNGAMDLGNPGPDYSYGFGVMDIYRSLQMIDNGHHTSNTISNGDSQSFNITVPPNTGLLKVMLCWNDVPANASAAKQLVNDLDLTVQDPASAIHLPLILDPTPANVNNNATEHADHTNNVEQVTITDPVAGVYTVKTKGYSIPEGPQNYVVAYDVMPKAIHLTYPIGGEQLSDVDSIRVFWDAGSDGNTFTMQVSQDNGGSWVTIDNNIPAGRRFSDFLPVNISTGNFLVRVSRNNTTDVATSQRFTVNAQPVVTLDTAQCPGYINIHWAPVLNASSYYLLRKVGYYMQVVDSATDTAYSFSNMPLTANSYVAVQPVINGLPGYRSIAVIAVANSGNCTKPVSAGDIMVEQIISPQSGRMYTSTQLGVSSVLQVKVRGLYTTACDSYTVSWQVNSGAWQSVATPVMIPANGAVIVSIPGLNLSAPGTYVIRVAVHNLRLPDPQQGNDSASVTVLNIPNDTISLAAPFFDGFETMAKFSVVHDSTGVSPNGHWDYFNANDSGRLRTFVTDDITITGNRSISLDAYQVLANGSTNTFVGTFNLVNYDTATSEVRVDFDYILHGRPKSPAGNVVTARGNDTLAWSPLYTYDLSAYPGNVTPVRSLSLTDAIRQSHHNFTAATQVSFGQSDTSLISAIDYGNGITLDNFRIYTVANDAALAAIVSPLPNNCGVASPGPVTVKVHNGVNYTLHNVHLFYSLDSGATFSGIIDSIPAKGDVNYTFTQQIPMTEGITHSLSVWLSNAGDTYTLNDSLLNYHLRNSRVIASYPYLENFEAGDGGYYSDGFRNSWQYGTPASAKINKAASGTKAWKTNLTGNYNNLELSYLYSPCFDLSGLTTPMLSFSTAMDIENCGGTLCDAAYIEVSYDGVTWTKLGSAGQGTNWYDSTFNVWNTEGFTRWHVASILLPQPGAGYTTHFRFVLNADPGANFEGLAVDDIHIFDLANPVYQPNTSASVTMDLSGNLWTDYLQSNNLLASIQPANQGISNTAVTLYAHDTLYNPGATQYTFPQSYTIKSPQVPADSVGVRLYLLESDMVNVLKDTTCPFCTPVADAYSLGITQYDNANNTSKENGTLADDTGGIFTFHPSRSVIWVPCDKGYYAEIKAKPFSEFWFNNGGPTGNFPAGIDYLDFTAYRNGSDVTSLWHSLIDTAVNIYTVQWSLGGVDFATVIDTPARHVSIADYSVNDPVNFNHFSVFYYRLKWTMAGRDNIYYSPIRRVDSSDSAVNRVTFNAQMINHQTVLLNWTSYLDGFVNHYLLERSIGSGSYSTIDDAPSLHHYGQQYNFTDQPGRTINTGTLLHYRLTVVMEDGTTVVLPEKTVEWINGNSLVNIYPNPTHDGRFSILWDADAGTDMHISIADVLGRRLYETTVTAAQWNNTTTLQVSGIASGVYFIRLDIGGVRHTEKIVFE